MPLTKPPLGAWAAKQIIAELPPQQRAELMRKWYPILLANQQWWMRAENCDELGRPQYLHPYSSGLDDSPVFDASGAVVSPDLLAYLIVQEQILREWAAEIGVECPLDNLPQLRRWLADLWDDEQGAYFAQNHAGVRQYRTILSLLGCFAPGIDSSRLRQLSADIENPERFHARWPLPTVAQDDPSFAENTMWRGPTWVNTTYLVADGLESNGELELAAKLRESTLEMFAVAGGPVEYVNSRSGTRCRTATTCFGWSAALYIDLAVREKNENALRVSFTSPM
ncbi:MGH1-like glycoside hydrolase domain-containing protein [Arcanobacterium hippocoleae]|uniref:MGH1-like glycoside hydrolase domain-containing protein n=1 Tax=Arcanobacterium hippocoleae TaxID=149017 RepID=UPI003340D3B3